MPKPPDCVGQFELHDKICNGDPETDPVPCAWRNRCTGLQMHCRGNGFTPAEVVAALDYKTLVLVCEKEIEKHDISSGVPGGPEELSVNAISIPGPTADEKSPQSRKSHRRKHPLMRPLKPKMAEMQDHFETLLRDAFPERRFASGNRVLAKPGQFYYVDRTRTTRYLTWYCTTTKGRDVALACLRFKQHLGVVSIKFPVESDDMKNCLGKDVTRALGPRPKHSGQFRTICENLGPEEVGLSVEALRTLIDTDFLPLPTP